MDVPELAERKGASGAGPLAEAAGARSAASVLAVDSAAPHSSDAGCLNGRSADATRAAGHTLIFHVATVLVVAAVVLVRLWPLVRFHMLGGILEYDDGVYYDAGVHLAGGNLPYRDFIFVQPPGIALLLAPFAALAKLTGDQTALILARIGIVIVAAANAYLMMRLLRRWAGPVAAVAAGGIYAAWGGAAATERTILLEPLLGLGLLGAMTLLSDRLGPGVRSPQRPGARSPQRPGARSPQRPGARVVMAGVVLGLAMAVKTWAVVDVVILALWLLWRPGWRTALAFLGGAVGTAAVVCTPFFIAAPGAMVRQVIFSQLGRTQPLTFGTKVFLHQVAGVGQVYRSAGASISLVVAVLVVFAVAILVTLLCGPRIWAVFAIVQIVLVVPQITYTYHYMDFAAPAVAACAGIAADRLLRAAGRLWRPAVLVPAAAIAAFVWLLAFQSVTEDVIGLRTPSALSAFVTAHRCTFSDFPAVLAVTNAETPQLKRHCPNLVDYTGSAFTFGHGGLIEVTRSNGQHRFIRPGAWQAEVRKAMAGSDSAVLTWRPERWTSATNRFFYHRFRAAGRSGRFKFWVLRGAGP
ncbi:MAG: hypothetical protein ACM3ML_24710 [Micromonosporaceae bacterium]